MSKYRVEFKHSRILLFLQLLSSAVLFFSVFKWQSDILLYQWLLQIFVVSGVCFYLVKGFIKRQSQVLEPVIFSLQGEWLELSQGGQSAWNITNKSRVSNLVVFVHLMSSVNIYHSKWCLVYKDQVTKPNFRRLCRVVIYQQDIARND